MGRPKLVLASASPRRKELLETLGVVFTICPSHVDESMPTNLPVAEALQAVALRKAKAIRGQLDPDTYVLAADTAVVCGCEVLGKPQNPQQATTMLARLSGRQHQVITAIALLGPGCWTTSATTTDVWFRPLSTAEIRWYVGLDEPYDKAGAYAIQGRGAFLVESIQGSYTNVVGLPMAEVARLLDPIGLTPWADSLSERGEHAYCE